MNFGTMNTKCGFFLLVHIIFYIHLYYRYWVYTPYVYCSGPFHQHGCKSFNFVLKIYIASYKFDFTSFEPFKSYWIFSCPSKSSFNFKLNFLVSFSSPFQVLSRLIFQSLKFIFILSHCNSYKFWLITLISLKS